MIWLVDDGPLEDLARVIAGRSLADWPKGEFWVATQTSDDAKFQREKLLAAAGSPFNVFEVEVGSEAADVLYTHLRAGSSGTADLAEHQGIAWALTEAMEACFVSRDKRALSIALAELGLGRVAHAFDLWIHLRDNELVTQDEFNELCKRTLNADQGLPGLPIRCRSL